MKYYFMHINKTAGKSIEQWFISNGFDLVGAKEDKCQRIIEHFNSNDFYFTVIRNPYTRIVSQFIHWKDNLHRIKENTTFDYYVKNLNNPKLFVKPEYIRRYSKKFHSPCSYWIKSNRFKIFRFEKLDELKTYFIDRLNFKNNFPHINTTEKQDTIQYFNKETLRIINDLMIDDFINFGYERYD